MTARERHPAGPPRSRRGGRERRGLTFTLTLAWDASAPDKTGCPPWCTIEHTAGEALADRAHSSGYEEISLSDDRPGWLGVATWQEPGHAAGISVASSVDYLPVMSPAETRQFAAALLARAADLEAGGQAGVSPRC